MKKQFILFVQLGSPKTPKVSDVRSYLYQFLKDPRVVDLNPILWKFILYFFILPFRPKSSAKLYSRIWDGQSFPLLTNTDNFLKKFQENIGKEFDCRVSYLLGSNGFNDFYDDWLELSLNGDSRDVFVVPLFPQYSEATSASVFDCWTHFLSKKVRIPTFKFLNSFHLSKAFIDNSSDQINNKYQSLTNDNIKIDHTIISFHGIPLRRVIYKFDPYLNDCLDTFFLIKENLNKEINPHLTFQSRFGSEVWLNPYTSIYCKDLATKGAKNILVYCPSFTADCLETIDEIETELNLELNELGCKVHLVSCLNDNDKWASDFAKFIASNIENKSKELTYAPSESLEKEVIVENLKKQDSTLPVESKKTLKIVFFTLFLDLVSFSIIFPMFPALAKHYIEVDPDNYFLNLIFNSINVLTSTSSTKIASVVLFGGALGALYSLLQFFASPLWGGLSDRIGRKPVLLVSIFGLMISYIIWFFSGSFTLLIVARFIGGIMGGNISTATAVVADITDDKNRSKGMAIIGISFAVGFIIGPALGGILSMIDLTKLYPSMTAYGVNPFSVPALLASVLCFINLLQVAFNFKETLPKGNKKRTSERSLNPFKLFKPLPIFAVNLTNFSYFVFLSAFSGMEFTLTFLAVDRLGYTSMNNAYMFIYIGFILTLVQGGYVRRKASIIGESKMAIHGLISIIPGLLIIAFCYSTWMLYLGLFFLAVGSGQIIPCLTSLVSIHSPKEMQGQSIGIFRSLGALARVIGPIVGAIFYWKYGSKVPYILGALTLVVPMILVAKIPKKQVI